jgi:hypothetical protein
MNDFPGRKITGKALGYDMPKVAALKGEIGANK